MLKIRESFDKSGMDIDSASNNLKTFDSKLIQTHIRFYSERGIQIKTQKFEDGSTRVFVSYMGTVQIQWIKPLILLFER